MRKQYRRLEETFERSLTGDLQRLGYVVLRTTVHLRRDKLADPYDPESYATGVSKGIPDLLVSRMDWGCFCGLELKRAGGRVRKEQKAFQTQGILYVVDDAKKAVEAIVAFEKRFGLDGPLSRSQ